MPLGKVIYPYYWGQWIQWMQGGAGYIWGNGGDVSNAG